MALLTLGLNHTTAPVNLREQVAFDASRLKFALLELCDEFPGIRESAILSTCNRTELYLAVDQVSENDLIEWMARHHQIDAGELVSHIYSQRDLEAARHMMRVAAGLDSLVLGEPQILGQFKDAVRAARDFRSTGPELDKAFSKVLSVAKQIRTETAIGRNPVSVAYASVNLASRIFSDLSTCKVVLVGAGETIQLVAEYLISQGVKFIDVVNRTLANAETLAASIKGQAFAIASIGDRILDADIVIASTGSPVPVLGKGAVERAQKMRRFKPMFMVDLAVPRDIEPEVGEIESVYLYTIDDLNTVVEEGLEQRQEAAHRAEQIIQDALSDWQREARGFQAVNTIRSLRETAQTLSIQELERAQNALEAGKNPEEVLISLSHSLTNKFLHEPTVALRRAAEQGDLSLIKATNRLFDLNDMEELD